jgi:hypothetical protein
MASRQTLGVRPDAAACRTRGRKADRLSPAQELRQALAVEHAEDKAGKFLLSADYAFEHGRELLARHGEYLRIELFLRGDRGLGQDRGSGRDDQGGVARHVKRAEQRDPIAKGREKTSAFARSPVVSRVRLGKANPYSAPRRKMMPVRGKVRLDPGPMPQK